MLYNAYNANNCKLLQLLKIKIHKNNFYVLKTIKLYFSVYSFKKDSSLHRVSNKDHVKPKKIYEKD